MTSTPHTIVIPAKAGTRASPRSGACFQLDRIPACAGMTFVGRATAYTDAGMTPEGGELAP